MAPPRIDPSLPGSSRALAADLQREVHGEVRFDRQARTVYSTDASNYRQEPVGVVLPRDTSDIEATLAVCHRHGAAVLPRGSGTSLAGQTTNTAVVLDLSRHLTHVEVDADGGLARVEPGVVLDALQRAAQPHGLMFGPDPATHAWCTLGGMLGNNSCGVHSLATGRTSDFVESLTVLTADGHRMTLEALDDGELARRIDAGGRDGEILAALRALGERVAPRVLERFPRIPRRVSGFNLDEILPSQHSGRPFHPARALVGTEGTCATVIEATVRLVPRPRERALLILSYPTLIDAAHAVPAVLEAGKGGSRGGLIGLEGIDRQLLDHPHVREHLSGAMELFPEGEGLLVAELGGFEPGEAAAAGERLRAKLQPSAKGLHLLTDPARQALAWRVREAGLGLISRHPVLGVTHNGWEDPAVDPQRLGPYVEDLQKLLDRHGLRTALFGHFGDGCVHSHMDFDLASTEGIARFRSFVEEAADQVVEHGGSLSGEHGDGQARGELLPRMFGTELVDAFRDFKAIWDPEGRMNPGKVVDARPLDGDLRPHPRQALTPLAPLSQPVPPPSRERGESSRSASSGASMPDSPLPGVREGGLGEGPGVRAPGQGGQGGEGRQGTEGGFSVHRCVGIGKCRVDRGGVMCPSFRATHAEEHSTRGRARLLGEMLTGGLLPKGKPAREVKDALDLCLACKGCKHDCPVSVDMATYKAEFLSRWYRFRPRPRSAYTLGWIFRWARLASRAPGLANAGAGSAVGSRLLKLLAGVAPERRLPRFAEETFRAGFARRPEPTSKRLGRRVVLWPDTFTNHFQPRIAHAAVAVLEAAGFEVAIPRKPLCCGRPLYDWGFLGMARRQLRRTLNTLHPEIAAGVPVIGLEPSCVATFRDEMPALFPGDPAAQDLSRQVFLLGEFLDREAPDFRPEPSTAGRALLHGHCHQKSVLGGMDADRRWLEGMGLEIEEPEPGCCGMAGAFGFETRHLEVARACGERALLPAVRETGADVLLVSDGFSCREQILQETGRQARHLAEVLAWGSAAPWTADRVRGTTVEPGVR